MFIPRTKETHKYCMGKQQITERYSRW